MQGIAKALLITILSSAIIVLLMNMAFFFPWYMTLVIETYSLSQVAANDNYVKQPYLDEAEKKLKETAIFKKRPNDIEIIVKKTDVAPPYANAVGFEDVSIYDNGSYLDLEKPYRQRGEPIEVTIKAVYPLTMKLWGKDVEGEIPMSFTITTRGLKHYKDLHYDYYQ